MWPAILFCGLIDSYWSYWSCTEYCRGWAYIRGTDVRRMELFWMSVAWKTPFSIIKTPLTFILNCSLLFLSLFVQCMLNINQKSGIFIDCLHGIYILGNLQDLWLVLFFILRLIFILPTSAFFCRFLFNWVSTFFLSSSFDTRSSDLNQIFVLTCKQLIKYWFSRNLKACYRI